MLATIMHVLWRLRLKHTVVWYTFNARYGRATFSLDPYNDPTGIRALADQSMRKPDKTEWKAKYMALLSRNKVWAMLGILFGALTVICVVLEQAVPQVYG